MRQSLIPVLVIAALGACAPAAEVETGPPSPAVQTAPPPATMDALPTGTVLSVRMDQTVSTETSKVGQPISATVTSAIRTQNGQAVVPAGAKIRGSITGLDDSDHPADRALIRLDFNRLEMNGRSYPLAVEVESAELKVGDRSVQARRGTLVGATAGAVLGAILSGAELDDILKGAVIGAGAGSVIGIVLAGDAEAELPAGSTMSLRTTQQITLR
jgi:hypothetical protein